MTVLIGARELLVTVRRGEEITPGALEELATNARTIAADLSQEDGRELYDIFQEILSHAEEAQRQTHDAMHRAGEGRRALSGYGHLKPNRRAQRVRKKV